MKLQCYVVTMTSSSRSILPSMDSDRHNPTATIIQIRTSQPYYYHYCVIAAYFCNGIIIRKSTRVFQLVCISTSSLLHFQSQIFSLSFQFVCSQGVFVNTISINQIFEIEYLTTFSQSLYLSNSSAHLFNTQFQCYSISLRNSIMLKLFTFASSIPSLTSLQHDLFLFGIAHTSTFCVVWLLF